MHEKCTTCTKINGKLIGKPFVLSDLDPEQQNGAIRGQLVRKKKQSFFNVWIGQRIVRTEANFCHKCGRKL